MIIESGKNFVDVGDGIYVSHRDACDLTGSNHIFSTMRKIHIWRDDMLSCSCKFVGDRVGDLEGVMITKGDMTIQYKDGESLLQSGIRISNVAEFFSIHRDEEILVHCMVGQTRSPTIAIIGKIARGCLVFEAISTVIRATWNGRGFMPNLCLKPMSEILTWAQATYPERM